MTPGQGCPDALVTVAVTVWVVPTGLTASGGVRVTVAGVPQLPPGMVVVVVDVEVVDVVVEDMVEVVVEVLVEVVVVVLGAPPRSADSRATKASSLPPPKLWAPPPVPGKSVEAVAPAT